MGRDEIRDRINYPQCFNNEFEHVSCPSCATKDTRIALLEKVVEFTFPTILRLIQQAYAAYAKQHPDWWKRIKRTPIPNDLSVVIGEYFTRELRRRAKEGK